MFTIQPHYEIAFTNGHSILSTFKYLRQLLEIDFDSIDNVTIVLKTPLTIRKYQIKQQLLSLIKEKLYFKPGVVDSFKEYLLIVNQFGVM